MQTDIDQFEHELSTARHYNHVMAVLLGQHLDDSRENLRALLRLVERVDLLDSTDPLLERGNVVAVELVSAAQDEPI